MFSLAKLIFILEFDYSFHNNNSLVYKMSLNNEQLKTAIDVIFELYD